MISFFNVKNIEQVYEYISKNDVAIAEECLNAGSDGKKVFYNKIRENYANMSEEEISKNLDDFIEMGEFDNELFDALPDARILLDKIDTININYQVNLLPLINKEKTFQYINENGKSSDIIIQYLSKCDSILLLEEAMKSISSDYNRAKILVQGGSDVLLPYITDQYYRTQIVKSHSELDFDEQELIDEMEQYNSHLNCIKTLDDDKSRAEYIAKIEDKDIKQSLLTEISEKKSRDFVINSFSRYVDPQIASLDNLSQTMIREFFEDTLGNIFTDDKKERLEIIFKRSDVAFANLELNTNGKANHVFKSIEISNARKNNTNRNLGFLVHEYSHLLSMFDFAYTENRQADSIEEGMADTFADTVINHYLEKNKNVILDGEEIRVDKPYITYTGYDIENAWVRTMLAGLEPSGKDKEAIGEYILGSKSKFTEIVFGKEIAKTKDRTPFDMIKIETNRKELYYSPELDFSNIDEESIYYKRNYILPLYQIQNRVKDEADVVGILSEGKSYYASYISDKYFGGRKFYEVTKEEFKKFLELLNLQITPGGHPSAIFGILEYKNELIDNLTEEEIKNFSFEILDDISVLWGNESNLKAGTNLENVARIAFEEEIKETKEGQPLEITKQKRDVLVQKYKEMFVAKNESNMYILDYVKDYDFACQQAEQKHMITSDIAKQIAMNEDVVREYVNAEEAINSLMQTKDIQKGGQTR